MKLCGIAFVCALTFSLLFLPSVSYAGFMATTGLDTGNITDTSPSGPSAGDTFIINQGTFATYTPDGPTDPQISGADLYLYGYTVSTTVNSVSGNSVSLGGTYEIFYNTDSNDTRDTGDLRVSSGNIILNASFSSGNYAFVSGSLTQTQGPENSAFADLSYGNQTVITMGSFQGDVNGQTGTVKFTLKQDANPPGSQTPAVPEPASLGVLGIIAVLGFAVKRRRRTIA